MYDTNDPYQLALMQLKQQNPALFKQLMQEENERFLSEVPSGPDAAFIGNQPTSQNLGMSSAQDPFPAVGFRETAGGQIVNTTPVDRAPMPDPQYFVDQSYANDPMYQEQMSGAFTGDPAIYSRAENFMPQGVGYGTEASLLGDPMANQSVLASSAAPAVTEAAASEAASQAAAEQAATEVAASGAAEAGGSSFGGPATFAGNMALNMIPTRDREKVDTPFGNEGSTSGMIKGAGKGALLGATIGSAVPVVGTTVGAIVGGTAGLIGGAQGYFDSTSAPIMQVSRIRQNRGLLGGGGANLYG